MLQPVSKLVYREITSATYPCQNLTYASYILVNICHFFFQFVWLVLVELSSKF